MHCCPNCNQIFQKKSQLDKHVGSINGCNQFLNLYNLKYNNQFEVKKTNYKLLTCNSCGKKYSKLGWFENHIQKCIQKKVENNIEKKIINNITNNNQFITNNLNTNNNLTVNIKLPFTPLSQMKNVISKEDFLKILNYENVDKVIQELVRLTYFSKESPENNYWCVSFPTQKFGALQYNPKTENIERWLTEEVVDYHFEGMMCCICPVMDDLYQKEIYATLNVVQKRNLNILYNYFGIKNLSSKYPNDYEKIKMIAYNNKHIPISFWKKLKFENRLDLSNEIPIQLDY